MSENADVAEFEAARESAMSDDGHEDTAAADAGHQEADAGEEGDDEPKPKNWEKIAQDKDAALAGERARRKAERKRAQELEDRLAKMEQERGSTTKDEWDDVISALRDDDEDPIGDIAAIKKLVKQLKAERASEREQEQTQAQSRRQFQALTSSMEESEGDFAAEHPDYFDAAKHYRTEREAELEALGYTGQRLQAALAQDLIGLVRTAMSTGKDPAETVYSLAKRRGFASGTAQAEDKLSKIAESARAGTRPSGGKPAGGGAMTASAVGSLKGAAFDAAFAKLRQQEKRAR